mmetsp:Transcript_80877/g.225052  ORF Transcript_80877/g.225052 Transcript_80877/m.225052 type:complete len:285 (+) Transcript_80877:420-1274(+)
MKSGAGVSRSATRRRRKARSMKSARVSPRRSLSLGRQSLRVGSRGRAAQGSPLRFHCGYRASGAHRAVRQWRWTRDANRKDRTLLWRSGLRLVRVRCQAAWTTAASAKLRTLVAVPAVVAAGASTRTTATVRLEVRTGPLGLQRETMLKGRIQTKATAGTFTLGAHRRRSVVTLMAAARALPAGRGPQAAGIEVVAELRPQRAVAPARKHPTTQSATASSWRGRRAFGLWAASCGCKVRGLRPSYRWSTCSRKPRHPPQPSASKCRPLVAGFTFVSLKKALPRC